MSKNCFSSHSEHFSLWGHSIFNILDFSNKTPRDLMHIVYQSDEEELHKVTKLLCIGQN